MAKRYLVDLNEAEQGRPLDLIKKGKSSARKVSRAHILLRAAEGATDEQIAEALLLVLSGSIFGTITLITRRN